jgi:ubiquinone/menaquinone biosynthesis C-methylase UbiE
MTLATDKWLEWLTQRRFGGNAEAAKRGAHMLHAVRNEILERLAIVPGETVLDVGCGDGLVAFGALDRVGTHGRVVFSDISEPLLQQCREMAASLKVDDRCAFVQASADDLQGIEDGGVDAVTTRSVLIYVADKRAAFEEFHRVLRPGGRLAIWEPINRFAATYALEESKYAEHMPAIAHLWTRFAARLRAQQPLDTDPMMNFDAHDLLRDAELAGFPVVRITYNVHVMPAPPISWDVWLNSAGNPNIPTTGETLQAIFSDDEMAVFREHARPVLERGGMPYRMASALLTATKAAGGISG